MSSAVAVDRRATGSPAIAHLFACENKKNVRHPELVEGSVPPPLRNACETDPSASLGMTGTVAFRIAAILLAIFALPACHQPHTHTYDAHGTIQHISGDRHIVTIQHEAIPDYMPAMTMDFSVRDPHVLDGLTRGDHVEFVLIVHDGDAWIGDAIRRGHTNLPAETTTTATPTLKPGDPLPNAEFIAEDGRHIHLSDFHGKAIALTFFFTRCPLPNYCPLMNRNFAAARAILLSQPNGPDNWQFLSISFDPDFDTPQQLAASAEFYRNHNADRWLFATATPDALAHFAPLGLIIERQDNSITHNLRTVVVDPNGKIFRQYNDNLWTPDQLAGVLRDAAEVFVAR